MKIFLLSIFLFSSILLVGCLQLPLKDSNSPPPQPSSENFNSDFTGNDLKNATVQIGKISEPSGNMQDDLPPPPPPLE